MPDDPSTAAIHALAIQEMLNLPKLYGLYGFVNILDSKTGRANAINDRPPATLVAALEQLETATVDPTLLTDGQTVASVEAHTITDLQSIASLTKTLLDGAALASTLTPNQGISLGALAATYDFTRLPTDGKLFTPATAKPPVTVRDRPPPPASGVEQYLVTNLTTGVSDWEDGKAYDGPVAALQNQFVTLTTDNVNVTATKPNSFIHTGSGNHGVDVSLGGGGTNVVDGGAGSTFVVLYNPGSGKGADTVFIDTRAAMADTWSTVVNFHAGDAATLWGLSPSSASLAWADNEGAAGATGLTLHATAAGKPTASLTLAGLSTADLNGKITAQYGHNGGGDYLYIREA